MSEFLIKYWLEALFTLIVGGLGFLCKKFYSLYIKEKNHQKTEEQKAFYQGLQDAISQVTKESLEGDKKLQEQINIIKDGVLSVQRKVFKQECKNLLREDREISLQEFEELQNDYSVYHDLGGNGNGTSLFKLVQKKVETNLTD